jgi:hypothetical protein
LAGTTIATFQDLLPIPHYSRTATQESRKRTKPPSYELTSDDTMDFVRQRHNKTVEKEAKKRKKGVKPAARKGEKKKQSTAIADNLKTPCTACHVFYGDASDPLKCDAWSACALCGNWYHVTCAENHGVIDDGDSFICRSCL